MRGRQQEGFTLPEVLVVLTIVPFILTAMLSALDTTSELAPRSVEHSHAVGESGAGMSRAMREVRRTHRVLSTTPNALTFLVESNGATTQVTISCAVVSPMLDRDGTALRRCVRTAVSAGADPKAPDAGEVLIDRVINGTETDPVFRYAPDPITPTYVRMLVKVPARGEGRQGTRTAPIVLEDGTLLRNNALGT